MEFARIKTHEANEYECRYQTMGVKWLNGRYKQFDVMNIHRTETCSR